MGGRAQYPLLYNHRRMEIQELKSEDELREAFPVMRELRSKVDEREYFRLLEHMVKEGYHLFALRDSGVIVALAGVAVLTNLSYGRHVWVYDLVTTSNARSKGYGRRLLEFVEEFAHQENCKVVALSSGLERTSAHRFYEKHMNYEKPSYVFKKSLL